MTRPSRIRYLVVGLLTAMAVLLYLDRVSLAIPANFIKAELHFSEAQNSWLLGAFFWSYALAQVPSGWLSDRFGKRLMLTVYILLWSLFTGLTGLVESFPALVLLQLGCGLAQAGAYPTSGGMLSLWVPLSWRGLASGIVSTGGRLGGVVAPLLTASLILFLVPLDVSSLVGQRDLLDARKLCQRMFKPGPSTADHLAAQIGKELPPASRGPAQRCANETINSSRKPTTNVDLVQGLNEIVRRNDLFESVNWHDVQLEPEAERLAKVPGDELTTSQIERRNRLLLEAAFPDEIRKVYAAGWRPVMLIYGLIGLLVAVVFWLWVRDRPMDDARCNVAERELIASGLLAASASGRVRQFPWRYLVASRSLWLSSLAQFGTNFGWIFILRMLPQYLEKVHQVPLQMRGWMSSLPILLGMAGMLAGGWVVDALTRHIGVRWGRCLPMSLTRFVALAAFLCCIVLESPWPVTLALCFVAVGTDLGTPATWAFVQDAGGRHVGSVLGWGNMWGNFGAAMSPPALTWIVGMWGWKAMFAACAAAFLVSGIAALGVDATKPIVPPDAE